MDWRPSDGVSSGLKYLEPKYSLRTRTTSKTCRTPVWIRATSSWRTPLLSGMRLPVALRFSDEVKNVTEPTERELPDSIVERRVVETTNGNLAGDRVEFVGLQATITDVLVRSHLLGQPVSTTLVRPSQPWVELASQPGRMEVAKTFVVHGIEHILFGYDHLLFVLALVFIAQLASAAPHCHRIYLGTLDYTDACDARLCAYTRSTRRSGHRIQHTAACLRDHPHPQRPNQFDSAAPMVGRLCFWTAARTWLRRSAGRSGSSCWRHSTGLVVLQPRRGDGTIDIHRSGDCRNRMRTVVEISANGWAYRFSRNNLCHWHDGVILVRRTGGSILKGKMGFH